MTLQDFHNPLKVFHHADRVEELFRTGDTRPVHMTIGLTNYCNHKCPWCYINWHQAGPLSMRSGGGNPEQKAINAPDRLIEAVAEAKELGLKAVTIVGDGEPTLHPRFIEMLEKLAALDLDIGIFTNLSTPRLEVLDAMREHCFFIRCSIDAADAETHKVTHGADDWDRIVRNFRGLAHFSDHPVLGVQFVVNQWNWRAIVNAAHFWHGQGADYIAYKPAYKHELNKAHDANEAPLVLVQQLLRTAEKFETDNFKVYTKEPQFSEVLGHEHNDGRYYQKCQATPLSPYLDEDGQVHLCGNMKGHTPSIGNVYEKSFAEIWNGEAKKRWLASIDLHKCPAGCKLDPLNKVLWDASNPERQRVHPNFV